MAAECFLRALALGHPEAPVALAAVRRASIVAAPATTASSAGGAAATGAWFVAAESAADAAGTVGSVDDTVTWALHLVGAMQPGATDVNFQSRAALGCVRVCLVLQACLCAGVRARETACV